MEKKEQRIIDYLSNRTDWTTTTQLSNALKLSSRSIKYSVSKIKKECPELIISGPKGYKCSHYEYKKNTVNNLSTIHTYNDRKMFLIEKILINRKKFTVYELADTFSITVNSLLNEFTKLRNELKNYDLNILTSGYVTFIGSDKNKKRVIMNYLEQEANDSFYSLDKMQKIFSIVDLKKIEATVTNILSQNNYFIDNYSLINYVLHLAIMIEVKSFSQADHYTVSCLTHELKNVHIIEIIHQIYKNLHLIYPYNFTLDDIFDASLLMTTRAKSVQSAISNDLHTILGEEVWWLMNDIIVAVNTTYGIDLSDKDFILRFGLHLKNLLLRVKNNIRIGNHQYYDIKENYPMIFAVSVYITSIIHKITHLFVPEEEISYIALHIGILIEQNHNTYHQLTCLLICDDYEHIKKNLVLKIKQEFSNRLSLVDVITSIDMINTKKNYDLVLSTHQIPSGVGSFQKKISIFLTDEEIREIHEILKFINRQKKKQLFWIIQDRFFNEELFFSNPSFNNSNEAIEYICNIMYEKNYVSANYKTQIYQHEQICSSAYGKIAIPHPLNNDEKKSAIAIAICPDSVQWGSNQVNLIMMLSLSEKDKSVFQDIFDIIAEFIAKEENFQKLLTVKSLEDFINVIDSST